MSHEYPNSLDCVSMHIRRAERATAQHYNHYLKPLGLRITQYTILSFLETSKQATASDLQTFLVADQTTVSRALRPLVRDGLISSQPGRDKRQKVLTLTKVGHELHREAFALWSKAQEELTNKIGDENKLAILEVSDFIVDHVTN